MGTIIDYVSNTEVSDKLEEVEAVEVFARRFVEDYGYPKPHIQTHPQFRVKVRPSDKKMISKIGALILLPRGEQINHSVVMNIKKKLNIT